MELDQKVTSRIFLIRHGATEWSTRGLHTSVTDVPLSAEGEKQVRETKEKFVGPGKLIDPVDVRKVYCSPYQRARKTCEILNFSCDGSYPVVEEHELPKNVGTTSQQTKQVRPIVYTDRLKEWDYGEYEGKTIEEVHELRRQRNQENGGPTWNIWLDGCEGGESPQQVSDRIDSLIREIIRDIDIRDPIPGGKTLPKAKNFVCIAHGHILASLALRWARQPLRNGMRLLMETAGIAVLGFEHDNIDEPAIILSRSPHA